LNQSSNNQTSVNAKSYKYYPTEIDSNLGDIVEPIVKYTYSNESGQKISRYGPILAVLHPAIVFLVDGVALIKLLPYTSIKIHEKL
jgi:hypothetical protein